MNEHFEAIYHMASPKTFPDYALGSRNIEYLFEYSEIGGIHYQPSA